MNADYELLSFIHKNAAMGVGTIPQAMALPQSRGMRGALRDQLSEYRWVAAKAQDYAKAHGHSLHRPSPAVFAMSEAMLRAQTALDPSATKLAERMIRGSTMGTVQMTRRLHQLSGRADRELVDLGSRLLRAEEQNIQQMKQFL